jgi:hypothetical protein
MKNKRVSQIISGVLSFMMMVCITILAVSISLSLTLFNSGFLTGLMSDKYYESALNSLTEKLKNEYAPPSHMPEEVFDGMFEVYQIKEDSQEGVRAILAGIDYSYDSSRVRNQIMNRFTKYTEDKKIDITETNLETLADYCMEEYENNISVPYLKNFATIVRLFQNMFTYILLICSFLLIFLALFLFRIHRFKHRALRFSVYSVFASALLIIPIPLFILIQGAYHKMVVSPAHFKMLFATVIGATLTTLVVTGLLIAAVGFALAFLVQKMREKAIRGGNDY